MRARSHTRSRGALYSPLKAASNKRRTLFTMTSLRASENVNKAGGGISALEDTLQQTGSNHDVASLRRMGACATSSKGILSQPLVVDPGQHGPPEYSPLSPDEKLLSQRGSTEPPPRMKYVIHNWRWEVFGVVVCVVATNAAIIVLKIYDKHPLSAWPLGIQVSSYRWCSDRSLLRLS